MGDVLGCGLGEGAVGLDAVGGQAGCGGRTVGDDLGLFGQAVEVVFLHKFGKVVHGLTTTEDDVGEAYFLEEGHIVLGITHLDTVVQRDVDDGEVGEGREDERLRLVVVSTVGGDDRCGCVADVSDEFVDEALSVSTRGDEVGDEPITA